jgi:hypothetical protein
MTAPFDEYAAKGNELLHLLIGKGMVLQDFENYDAIEKSVRAVFRRVNYYLSEGEFEDIIALMPVEIKKLLEDSIGKSRMVL